MEISDVRRQLRGAIERARHEAAERRARTDAARRDYEQFLSLKAIPVFHQVALALVAEGQPFKVFTPAESVRLASDHSPESFIEIVLDDVSDRPQVTGRSSRGRGAPDYVGATDPHRRGYCRSLRRGRPVVCPRSARPSSLGPSSQMTAAARSDAMSASVISRSCPGSRPYAVRAQAARANRARRAGQLDRHPEHADRSRGACSTLSIMSRDRAARPRAPRRRRAPIRTARRPPSASAPTRRAAARCSRSTMSGRSSS